jgi:hypothetical protein
MVYLGMSAAHHVVYQINRVNSNRIDAGYCNASVHRRGGAGMVIDVD